MNKRQISRLLGMTIGIAALGGIPASVVDASGGSGGNNGSIWVVDTGIAGNPCPAVGAYEQVTSIPAGATVFVAKTSSTGHCFIGTVAYKLTANGTPMTSDILYQQIPGGTAAGDTYIRVRN